MEVDMSHNYLPALYRQATEKLPSSKLREELNVSLRKVRSEEVIPTIDSREEFNACFVHLMPLIKNNPFGLDIKDSPIYAGDTPMWKPYKPDCPTYLLNMKVGKITGKHLEPGYVMFPLPKKTDKMKLFNLDVTSDDKQHLCPKKMYHAMFYAIENGIERLKALVEKDKSRSRLSRRSDTSQRTNKNSSPTRNVNSDNSSPTRHVNSDNSSPTRNVKHDKSENKENQRTDSSDKSSEPERRNVHENKTLNRVEHMDSRQSEKTDVSKDAVRPDNISRQSQSTDVSLPPIFHNGKLHVTENNNSRNAKRSEGTQNHDFEMLQSRSSKRSDALDSRQSKRTDVTTKSRRKPSASTLESRRNSKTSDVSLLKIPLLFDPMESRPGSKESFNKVQRRSSTKKSKVVEGEVNLLLKVPTMTDMVGVMRKQRSDAGAETIRAKRDKLHDDGTIQIPDIKLVIENNEHFLLVMLQSGRAVEIIPSIADSATGPFYVAKPHANDENPDSDMRWRVSFAPNEESILSVITSGDKNQRLLAAKLVTGLCNSEWKLRPITQYHIKTVLLHEVDFQVDNTPRWQRLSLDECVNLILLRLLYFVQSKCLPHFFEDEFNLWSHVTDRQFRFMKTTLEKLTNDDQDLIRALRRMRVEPILFE